MKKHLVDPVKQVRTCNILVTFIFSLCTYICIYIVPGVVELQTDQNTIIWSPPLQPNGIITGYQVIYSIYQNDSNRASGRLSSSTTRYTIGGLSKHSVSNVTQSTSDVKV